jgi:hypothetical protein
MLRTVIWGTGILCALLAGRAIADCCAAVDEALSDMGPPEPPQPTQRVRVYVVRVPVGEAPEEV